MKLTSDFEHEGMIPEKYTCDGANIAPILKISEVPENTKSFALIVDDPDAPVGLWVHWVLYNIPASTTVIDENNLPTGTTAGMTNFGFTKWGGPCPPDGMHRYYFKLYALDKELNLPHGLNKKQLEEAIKDSIIEKTELMGRYILKRFR